MADDLLAIRGLEVEVPDATAGPRLVVAEVDLVVRAADRIGIVGESGAGKSLTLLAAVGLIPPPARRVAGSIEIDGRDLDRLSANDRAAIRGRRVALLMQGAATSLSPTWTVGAQLSEVLRLHRGLTRRQAAEAAAELLESVAVQRPVELLDAWPHELSGGQAQRVVLALALAGDPAVLLADEPTTGLDGVTRSSVLDLLDRVCDQRRLALILVSHDVSMVARLVRRVHVMLSGRIVEQGPIDRVLSDPRHPYTRRLVSAAIDGHAPPIVASDEASRGCVWSSRCPLVREACRLVEPALDEVALDHRSRCPVTAGGAEAV
jgi:oligopeptide/dipeptide ABC transporter ATP-binding protein